MNILVTGSAGFIGAELVRTLESDHTVIPYSRRSGKDILNYPQLAKAMRGVDVVVHLAAIRKPMEDKKFSDYWQTNCIGTSNVAEAARIAGVKRVVYASSTSYYGMERGVRIDTPVSERSPILTQRALDARFPQTRPCDIAYSTSKVIGEQILANYGLTKTFEVVILRLGPTRKRGEYRPFGELKLHLKIDNAIQALRAAILSKKKLWYEAFTIMDDMPAIDLRRAKKILGYRPM